MVHGVVLYWLLLLFYMEYSEAGDLFSAIFDVHKTTTLLSASCRQSNLKPL